MYGQNSHFELNCQTPVNGRRHEANARKDASERAPFHSAIASSSRGRPCRASDFLISHSIVSAHLFYSWLGFLARPPHVDKCDKCCVLYAKIFGRDWVRFVQSGVACSKPNAELSWGLILKRRPAAELGCRRKVCVPRKDCRGGRTLGRGM